MNRKVFISVLGTGFYNPTSYGQGEFHSSETRFIQIATLELIQSKSWNSSDVGYVLLTEKARKTNWDKSIQERLNTKLNQNEEYNGLENEIENLHLPFKIKGQLIPDGNNKEEMFAIFQTLYNLLEDGDELYFDMTHGFRYLPMLVLVLGNYAKFLRHIKICSISYGNVEKKPAEIVDLMPLSELQDWTDAVEHLTYSGNAEKLVKISQEGSDRRNISPEQHALDHIVVPLNELTLDFKTCRGKILINGSSIQVAKGSMQEDFGLLPAPFVPVLESINQMLNCFSDSPSWKNGFIAAKWCFDHQQYQQSVTFILESVVTAICFSLKLDWNNHQARENDAKKVISSINDYKKRLHMHSELAEEEVKLFKEELYTDCLRNYRLKSRMLFIISHIELFTLCEIYSLVVGTRNKYNHGGMLSSDEDSPSSIIKTLGKQIRKLDAILNIEELPVFEEEINSKSLFINISNHPSSLWTEKQQEAALTYGEIIDIPFPDVDVNADIKSLTINILSQVNQITEGNTDSVIHVMGEMTLTYSLVNALSKIGYKCLASVTRRNVEYNSNGDKISTFSFERFRDYCNTKMSN